MAGATSPEGGEHMRAAYIVSAARTAVGRAVKGTLKDVRPEDLGVAAVKGAVERATGLSREEIDDVILGCAMPEGSQGMNIARVVGLMAGLPVEVPAMTINRFCSSGLQAIALASQAIMSGMSEIIVAGGVESMSAVPMGGYNILLHPDVVDTTPEAYTPMGNTAEIVAERFGITRADQDTFAVESHRRAVAAQAAGRFKDEIVPVRVRNWNGDDFWFDTDEGPRADTSIEGLAKLKTPFKKDGTVTPGNASPINDGAAAVVVMSEDAVKRLGLKPLLRFVNYQVAGVAPEIMGIGPVAAIPKVLRKAGMTLADIDLIELNEAFAAQSVYCVRELGLDPAKTNVNGGAIALGHPLGATGAKLSVQMAYEMPRRNARYGLVSMCIGGGMGGAGIFERV